MSLATTTKEHLRSIIPTPGGLPSDLEDSATAKLVVNGTAIAAGLITKEALEMLWRSVREDDPPNNPAAAGVSWKDAIIWGAAVGAAVGVSRVISRRGTTTALRKYR